MINWIKAYIQENPHQQKKKNQKKNKIGLLFFLNKPLKPLFFIYSILIFKII